MNAALGLRADFLAAGFLAAFLAGILGFSSWNGPPLLPKTGRTLTEDARPSKALSPSGDHRTAAPVKPPSAERCAGRRLLPAGGARRRRKRRRPGATPAPASRRRVPAPLRRAREGGAPRAARARRPLRPRPPRPLPARVR